MSDEDSYCSDADNFCDDDYYRDCDPDFDVPESLTDPEFFECYMLDSAQVEELLNTEVENLSDSIKISPSLAKLLLHTNKWELRSIEERYKSNAKKLLQESRLRPTKPAQIAETSQRAFQCPICLESCPPELVGALNCNHRFCRRCWEQHFCMQIQQGLSTVMECMAHNCHIIVPEDFVNSVLKEPQFRAKYHKFAFRDYVSSHPSLRFCPGPNCPVVVRAERPQAKKVQCSQCTALFCFMCGNDYHAPTACDVIKQWLTKCADDSETANYISANTKDCPNCNVCIEKNGGCNHMQCFKCHHDFCWMCLGDWKSHGGEYYECSRYKENPNVVNESAHAQAREALKMYLFYFERWENHARSLKLEVETTKVIRERIEHKVQLGEGTWIDWQYLLKASQLLRRCRYTLQYTYPYAYYKEKSARKELFEYQQAQLEQEVENLSWKVERAQITDRGDLENQMDIAEKRRLTLLRDFIAS